MTVSEVIAELQRWPGHLPVLVLMSEVWMTSPERGDDFVKLSDGEAIDATDVRYEGSYVVVIG